MIKLLQGDCREVLATMEAESVQTCVTSPPYYGLRAYLPDGHPDKASEIGLEQSPAEYVAQLVEVFREVRRVLRTDGTAWLNLGDSYATQGGAHGGRADNQTGVGAKRTHMAGAGDQRPRSPAPGLKPKDLMQIPARVALALQQPDYLGQIANELDRVWLAAMIDAEGCIYAQRQPIGTITGRGRRSVRSQDCFCIGVTVSNTNEAVLTRMGQILGKENIRRVESAGNRRPHYSLTVMGSTAKAVLREVYPYLVAKQKEARIALALGPSGDQAFAQWSALKDIHKGRTTDVDAAPPDARALWGQGWWIRSEIIWSKSAPMPESVRDRPTCAHEKVWLLTKAATYFYDADAVAEQADPKNHRSSPGVRDTPPGQAQHSGYKEGRFFETRNLRNVWHLNPEPCPLAHFATMPATLAERCIKAGSRPGDTVMDPFAGAGTTLLVSDRLQRHAVGIELNPAYCDLIRKRLAADAPLFSEVA